MLKYLQYTKAGTDLKKFYLINLQKLTAVNRLISNYFYSLLERP